MKVKDHDHITGKYQQTMHQECNLNLILTKTSPVVFLNIIGKNYLHHLSSEFDDNALDLLKKRGFFRCDYCGSSEKFKKVLLSKDNIN